MEENLVTNPETNSPKKISLKVFVLSLFIVGVISSGATFGIVYFLNYKAPETKNLEELKLKENNKIEEAKTQKLTKIDIMVCGLSFEIPENWKLIFNTENENSCYFQVGVDGEPLKSIILKSSGPIIDGWNDIEYLKNTLQEKRKLSSDDFKIEPIPLLGSTAILQTLYTFDGKTKLNFPVKYLFISKGKNIYSVEYSEQDFAYNKETQSIISSIKFTQPDSFYEKPLKDYMISSINKRLNDIEDRRAKHEIDEIYKAIIIYKDTKKNYPLNLNELFLAGYITEIPTDIEISYIVEESAFKLSAPLSNGEIYIRSSSE